MEVLIMNQPFLEHMFKTLGKVNVDEPINISVTAEPSPKPVAESKQDSILVQVMGSDMEDSYYVLGHKDMIDFLKKFNSGEYGYNIGGLFGTETKTVNEGRPMWVEAFHIIAKPAKKGKTAMFIDTTNPKETIDEVTERLRINYPDLIIGF